MTAGRLQLRASELASPDASARNLNDILQTLQRRLEVLERFDYAHVRVTTDVAGNMSPVTISAPDWKVQSVTLGRAWDATQGIPFVPARFGWQQDGRVLTVSLWPGDVSPSTNYDLTVEVRG